GSVTTLAMINSPCAPNPLAVYDDGSGPALYVAGHFRDVNSSFGNLISANGIAKWDGSQWRYVGLGMNTGFVVNPLYFASSSCRYGGVDCLAVFDDGNGPRLFAGGYFESVDGVPARQFAAWDGIAWSAMADFQGEDRAVESLQIVTD